MPAPRYLPWICLCLTLAARQTGAQEAPPAPKLEFLQPAAGTTLQGVLQVRVRTSPDNLVPEAVYLSFYGPPWSRLQRIGDTNEWQADLDTRLTGNGPNTLVARAYYATTVKPARAEVSLKVVLDNPLQCYFGELHGHSGFSDGRLLPADAYEYARRVARLDFFVLTDHLEGMTPRVWADSRAAAWKAHEDGAFVVLTGLEWTKPIGHACIFDPPSHRWPLDLTEFYAAVVQAGIVAKINHPGRGADVFDGLAYSEIADQAVQLMEVRGDNEEQAYLRALAAGWHLGPDGSDDNHAGTWGTAGTWMAVVMPGLSRANLWAALQGRHCYSTADRNCRLILRVNGTLMGDVAATPTREAQVSVEVGDEAPDAIARIELFENGQIVATDTPGTTTRRWELTRTPTAGSYYYFVKVTQADGQRLWSAPVWVTIE